MSATLSSMQSFPFPSFAPSSAGAVQSTVPGTAQQGDANLGWTVDATTTSDGMDFDLLAEYLLDDSNASALVSSNFDFSDSGVVSPERSDDGGLLVIGDDAKAQVQQLAAQQQQLQQQQAQQQQAQQQQLLQQQQAQQQAQQQQLLQQQQQLLQQQQQAQQLAVQQQQAQQPQIATQQQFVQQIGSQQLASLGVQIPGLASGTAVPASSLSALQGNVAAQVLAQQTGVPQLIVNQPGTVKRRRVDGLEGAPVLSGQQLAEAANLAQGRGRKKSQAQIDRRRERNRILARRTRLRKKFFFESLQKEVLDLQRENASLKDIVRKNMEGDDAKKLLDDCKTVENLPEAVLEACGGGGTDMDQQDFNLVRSIQQSQHSFVISDPSLQDNPIVFASEGFLALTGYAREDVLGRNCRFLQGTETSQEKVALIRKAVANGEDVSVTFINYRADGTPFWNKLFIASLRDAQNSIVNFIGVSVKVAGPDPGDPEFGKLLPGQEDHLDGEDIDLGD